MSSIFQFLAGSRATKSIVNAFSTSGWTPTTVNVTGGRVMLSGATTANTLKTLLTATGAGALSSLLLTTLDSTARTLRLRVLVDGLVVFDSTSNSVNASGVGCLIGSGTGAANAVYSEEPVRFLASLEVQVASSLTETDKLQLAYKLHGY